jgi:hypothetical protein
MRHYVIPVLVIIILTGLCVHFYKNTDLYGYDEADYMYAAGKGIAANYLDDHALPLKTFIESGSNLGKDKSKRTELSELIRSSDDISFYRHYHGPLFFYWLNLLRFFGCTDESSFRAGALILLGLTACLLLWAAVRVHGLSLPWILLPVVLLFGSQMNIMTDAELTPHAMYCLTSLLALVLLSRFLSSNRSSDWYAALFALALAFLSIEYAVLVAAVFILCLFVHRRSIFTQYTVLPFMMRSVGFLFLAIGVLWLGGIIKLTLVKNYLFFTYFTIVRGGEFGSGNFFDVWLHRFADSPVICILSLATVICFAFRLKKNAALLPYLAYPLLVVITSLRNTSTSPTYVSSIFPPIFLLSGIVLYELTKGKKMFIPIGIIAAIAFASFFFLKPTGIHSGDNSSDKVIRMLIPYLGSVRSADMNLIVPRSYLPSLHYYNRNKHFSSYAEEFDDLITIEGLLSHNSPDGFLYIGKDPERYAAVLKENTAAKADTLRYDPQSGEHMIYYHLSR